ncbi:hypothetical protein V8G54_012762 [Vigna mungo]|uniref:Reverse transcriptase domain-containing protein n=1 Tax=Vigna mungo TaxID=3915 RepID=A0AAQ3S454_VIGMU
MAANTSSPLVVTPTLPFVQPLFTTFATPYTYKCHCIPPLTHFSTNIFQFYIPRHTTPNRPHNPRTSNCIVILMLIKQTMTPLINIMLIKELFDPTQAFFSSPIIFIKKSTVHLRFCVNYRALNAIIIKNHFPIPTIQELLDELTTACVFTKLDQRITKIMLPLKIVIKSLFTLLTVNITFSDAFRFI